MNSFSNNNIYNKYFKSLGFNSKNLNNNNVNHSKE